MLACMKIIFVNVLDPLKAGWLIYVAKFKTKKFYVIFTEYVCGVCVDLRINSDCYSIQHYLTVFFMTQNQCVYCVVRTETLRIFLV